MQQPQRADAAAHEPASTVVETHGASAEAEPALPRILIIGDSISMGYHDALVQRLRGVAHVCRPDVNCSSTRTGLENLSSWLTEHGPEPWDLIQFNHGLHGTQRARARIPASPIDIRQCVQPESDCHHTVSENTLLPPSDGKRGELLVAKESAVVDDLPATTATAPAPTIQ